jgi:DNA end-binding protein Ku
VKGDHHLLAVTTTQDEITGDVKPLFSFPVQVCKATEDREVKFDIATPSGGTRKQVYVDEATGEAVEDADCLRGIRTGDEFHAIPAEAIEQINAATKIKTMVALGTIDMDDYRMRYAHRSTGTYYLQSPVKGGTPKAYRLVYEALQANGEHPARAIVTKRTARSRQKLCVIYADPNAGDDGQGCLVMEELRFANQLRAPDEQVLAPLTAKVEQKQIDTARLVINKLGDGATALDSETDEAIALKEALIEQALAGETLTAPTPVAETAATDDLEALLAASLAQAD